MVFGFDMSGASILFKRFVVSKSMVLNLFGKLPFLKNFKTKLPQIFSINLVLIFTTENVTSWNLRNLPQVKKHWSKCLRTPDLGYCLAIAM